MIRLDKLYIKGFKDPNREINLTFADGPITVIFGKNGCGKTTLLNVLSAVFQGNAHVLHKENIEKLELDFSIGGEKKKVLFFGKKELVPFEQFNLKPQDYHPSMTNIELAGDDKNVIFLSYKWEGDNELLRTSESILFGVHRGVSSVFDGNSQLFQQKIMAIIESSLSNFLENHSRHRKNLSITEKGILSDYQRFMYAEMLLTLNKKNKDVVETSTQHINKDFITINSIEESILAFFAEGRTKVMEKTSSAFFETIENFENQSNDNFDLPNDVVPRIKNKMDFVKYALSKQNNSNLKDRLDKYIRNFDSEILNTKISRALLVNILEKAEEPNPALDAVQELERVFNSHLSYNKKIQITNDSVFISLGENSKHSLEKLSSGERNLLTMLTLFLIIGQNRNFLIIDEPENSLHLEWQEEFLQLISKMNPNAQIIVATHSPAIASDTKSLVELI